MSSGGEIVGAGNGAKAALRVQLFGRLAVWIDEQPIPSLRTRKGQWLLALLALRQGRELERSRLAGTLWPDSLETQAYGSLRRALTDLRQALGSRAGCIESPSPSTLCLAAESVFVDAAAFDEAIARGDGTSLERAISLHQGPLLEDCPEPWVILERETREHAYVAALEKVGELALDAGDLSRAETFLRRAALADPLRESVQRRLMEDLAHRGDLAAAVAAYRELRLHLREELNCEPDPQTTALYHSLRDEATTRAARTGLPGTIAGEARPAAPAPEIVPPEHAPVPEPRPASPPAAHHTVSLPRPLTEFIGRREDVRSLLDLLADTRLVTLTGPGGIGKTRLALQVAEEYAAASGDDVCFADLAPLHNAVLVPETVARAIGVREEDGRGITETMASSMMDRRILLVLDNCEHLYEACAALVQRLLASAQGLRVLTTSRRALGMTGEAVWRVGPLSLPAGTAVDDLDESEAARLFVQRALAARADFAVTERNAAAVEDICRRLDGMPLALELAAARLKVLTAEQIAARLDRMFELLSAGSTTALPRHRTLRAAIDWSYESLGEPEQVLVRRLSVFPGRFSLEAAEAVCQPPVEDPDSVPAPFLDLMSELVEQSFLAVEEHAGEARFRMPGTTQEYGRERLRAAGEEDLMLRRHAEYLLSFVEGAAPLLDGPAAPEWLDRIEDAFDDIRAALEYWVTASAPDARENGLRMVNALWGFWLMRNPGVPGGDSGSFRLFTEPAGWLEQLLAGGAPHTSHGARALRHQAELYRRQSDLPAARTMAERCLAVYEEIADVDGAASALRTLAGVERVAGNDDRARGLYERSLNLFHEAGDSAGAAECLSGLGWLAYTAGDYSGAVQLHSEGLRYARAAAHPLMMASALTDLGNAAYAAGDFAAAARAHAESLEIDETLQHSVGIAWSLANLAEAELALGDLSRSQDCCVRALALFLSMTHRAGVADCLNGMGIAAHGSAEDERAVRLLGAAAALRQNLAREITEPGMLSETVAALRATLGADRFDALWSEGGAEPWETAEDAARAAG